MIVERVVSDLVGKHSPSALTRQLFLVRGYEFDDVERRITRFVKKDLFGFADHLAFMHPGQLVFIQSTSASNHAARVKKIAECELARLLATNHAVCVVSWRTKKVRKTLKDGSEGKQWRRIHEGRIATFQMEDFTA